MLAIASFLLNVSRGTFVVLELTRKNINIIQVLICRPRRYKTWTLIK